MNGREPTAVKNLEHHTLASTGPDTATLDMRILQG